MLKQLLESTYDIPFFVDKKNDEYLVRPENDLNEYFDVRIQFRNQVRIIIDIFPQKYAGPMLNDIAAADEEKKALFFDYVDEFHRRKADVRIEVNGEQTSLSVWPEIWRSMHIQIKKIEDQDINFDDVVGEWAVMSCGMVLALLNIEPIEDDESSADSYHGDSIGFVEGRKFSYLETGYERNRANRALCLSANGYDCKVCGMNFEQRYGAIGKNFIHVHHIEMVSKMEAPKRIDPRKDLVPVCPNCHAMLHTKVPPFLPNELKNIYENAQKRSK